MARRKKTTKSEATRRATFRKRRKGLLKKAAELTTLCGVEACAIIYGPEDTTPEVWPTVHDTTAALERFRLMPEVEQTKKMMNWERFYGDLIAKAETKIARAERENNETRCAALMFRCMADPRLQAELDLAAVSSLLWTVDTKLKDVWDMMKTLEQQHGGPSPPIPDAAAVSEAPVDHRELLGKQTARTPSPDLFAGFGEEMEGFDDWLGSGAFNDCNPQLFWTEEEEDSAAGLGSTATFSDDRGCNYSRPPDGGASTSKANVDDDVNETDDVESRD